MGYVDRGLVSSFPHPNDFVDRARIFSLDVKSHRCLVRFLSLSQAVSTQCVSSYQCVGGGLMG